MTPFRWLAILFFEMPIRPASSLVLAGAVFVLCWPAPCSALQSGQGDETHEAAERASHQELLIEGVIIASDSRRSVALVRRSGASYARAVSVGETIYGVELLEVSADEILVREGPEVLRLSLSGERLPTRTPAPTNPLPEPPVEIPASVRTAVQRQSVEARLSEEMPRILTQTALTPRVVEGRVQGFRITRLPAGTVLDDAGIRTGDVLVSINEIALNSPYTLIELYPRLQAEEEIRVVLERGGRTVTYVYNFN